MCSFLAICSFATDVIIFDIIDCISHTMEPCLSPPALGPASDRQSHQNGSEPKLSRLQSPTMSAPGRNVARSPSSHFSSSTYHHLHPHPRRYSGPSRREDHIYGPPNNVADRYFGNYHPNPQYSDHYRSPYGPSPYNSQGTHNQSHAMVNRRHDGRLEFAQGSGHNDVHHVQVLDGGRVPDHRNDSPPEGTRAFAPFESPPRRPRYGRVQVETARASYSSARPPPFVTLQGNQPAGEATYPLEGGPRSAPYTPYPSATTYATTYSVRPYRHIEFHAPPGPPPPGLPLRSLDVPSPSPPPESNNPPRQGYIIRKSPPRRDVGIGQPDAGTAIPLTVEQLKEELPSPESTEGEPMPPLPSPVKEVVPDESHESPHPAPTIILERPNVNGDPPPSSADTNQAMPPPANVPTRKSKGKTEEKKSAPSLQSKLHETPQIENKYSRDDSVLTEPLYDALNSGVFTPRPLGMPSDSKYLTEFHCFLRQNLIEVFCANEDDINAPRRGRKKPVLMQQCGVRCMPCAIACREYGHTETRNGAVYYPTSISSIYNSVMLVQQRHFNECKCISTELRAEYRQLKQRLGRSGAAKDYWEDAARKMGLVDTPEGIFFQPSAVPALGLTPSPDSKSSSSDLLIVESDRQLATEYAFLLMSNMKPCSFTESDRLGKRRSHRVGFPGIQCMHCSGANGSGRYFPSSIKTFADVSKTMNVLHGHLIKCTSCPESIQARLESLKGNHVAEKESLQHGSMKTFFDTVWSRLHNTSSSPSSQGSASNLEESFDSWDTKSSGSTKVSRRKTGEGAARLSFESPPAPPANTSAKSDSAGYQDDDAPVEEFAVTTTRTLERIEAAEATANASISDIALIMLGMKGDKKSDQKHDGTP